MKNRVISLLWSVLAFTPIMLLTQFDFSRSGEDNSVTLPFEPQQPSAAGTLLNADEATAQTAEKRLNRGLILWQQAEYHAALPLLSQAAALGSEQARVYQSYAQHWLADGDNHTYLQGLQNWASADCAQQVVLVTAELTSLSQAEEFIQRYQSDTRLAGLPLCIAPQIVFIPDKLPCFLSDADTRIDCDLSLLAPVLETVQFTHLVLFTAQGKANVHNGIMFLDRHDTYDVFVHELAHFAGFVDEYALSSDMAKWVCQGVDAPNMVFRQAGQAQADMHFWRQLGRDINVKLTPAKTCDNHPGQAFKASSDMTFMEYHDLHRIPPGYLQAWAQALRYRINLTPAYVNLAQSLALIQPKQATRWQARYQAFIAPMETDTSLSKVSR